MSLIVSKLPPTSPLVPLTLDSLKAKVEETMGLTPSFPAPQSPPRGHVTQQQTSQQYQQGGPLDEPGKVPEGQGEGQGGGQQAEVVQTYQTPAQQQRDPELSKLLGAAPRKGKYEPYMVIILFELLGHVHRHMLHYLLDIIEEMVSKTELKMRLILCHLLFKIISKNYDYTRKEVCIKWYLELCHKLGLNNVAKL
jgi:hypothetical protein